MVILEGIDQLDDVVGPVEFFQAVFFHGNILFLINLGESLLIDEFKSVIFFCFEVHGAVDFAEVTSGYS